VENLNREKEKYKFVTCTKMRVFSYYDKIKKEGIVTTSLRNISAHSGIKYSTLANWFRNGRTRYGNEDIIIFKAEVTRGNQRFK
jgi:hypothetical protein